MTWWAWAAIAYVACILLVLAVGWRWDTKKQREKARDRELNP